MTPAKKYWLVYYGQRPPGRPLFVEANEVIDKHPAQFLLELLKNYPSFDNRLTFAIEIDAKTHKALKEHL